MIKTCTFLIRPISSEEGFTLSDFIMASIHKEVPIYQSSPFIPLGYSVREESTNELLGGITTMRTFWEVIEIQTLFVVEPYRKRGIGGLLLKTLEEEALRLGSPMMIVDTYDWQGKEFYEKMGFEIFGELDNCPPGHKRYYLNKVL